MVKSDTSTVAPSSTSGMSSVVGKGGEQGHLLRVPHATDVCVPDRQPCLNGGTCHSGHCICLVGYGGQFCGDQRGVSNESFTSYATSTISTTTVKICDGKECLNGGYCSPGTNRCHCLAGYTGRYCQNPSKGMCASSPCMYDTVCAVVDDGADFHCACPKDFSGKYCEQITCGSNTTLSATVMGNMITSLDYPNDGLPAMNCSWSVKSDLYFVKISIRDIHLGGASCNDSFLEFYNFETLLLIKRLCPENSSTVTFETIGSRSVLIRYGASSGSYFSLTYSSPDLDSCYYFNNASCEHGKCWSDETRANCICDPCYKGIDCSEEDSGNCTDSYCDNGGTCSYNCYLQTKWCHCMNGYDPKTNCAHKCSDTGNC